MSESQSGTSGIHVDERLGRLIGHAAQDGQGRLAVERRDGRCTASYSTLPRLNRSARGDRPRRAACSGAMYSGVPATTPRLRQAGVVDGAGQAEVGELDPLDAVFQQDVGRLDVAVDEARRRGPPPGPRPPACRAGPPPPSVSVPTRLSRCSSERR